MIQPGLARISKLLATTDLPWRAVHVAGTNGKGTICHYASTMLKIYNDEQLFRYTNHEALSWARFTSPHLVDRWDGIVLNGNVLSKSRFLRIEEEFLDRNEKEAIQASEFEILTAVAFKAFTEAKVDVGIVEVGMGGRDDATNIIGTSPEDRDNNTSHRKPVRASPLVTAISKIGLDHQGFLGDTISDIARHKAGIMKPGTPVVLDESNEEAVRSVVIQHAVSIGIQQTSVDQLALAETLLWGILPKEEQPAGIAYESGSSHVYKHNNSVALRAVLIALTQLGRLNDKIPAGILRDVLRKMIAAANDPSIRPPGRSQLLELPAIYPQHPDRSNELRKILLDGAHNPQSAELLRQQVRKIRDEQHQSYDTRAVHWILAVSQGRNLNELLRPLLEAGDSIFAVEFGPVDGMPWVKPTPARDILTAASRVMKRTTGSMINCGNDVKGALLKACRHALPQSVVAAGSLYLAGDIHRILRHDSAVQDPEPGT